METTNIPARSDVKKEDSWDLELMYPDVATWENEYTELEASIPRYNDFKGRLGQSLSIFKECLELDFETGRRIEKLYVYAHLLNDQDKTDSAGETLYQRAFTLYRKISEESSYIVPEMLAIAEETINSYMNDPSMGPYRFYLEKIIRYRSHTLSEEIEKILAMGGEIFGAPSKIFSQLDNADLSFGSITDSKGQERELSHGNFITFLMDPDRDTRRKAFFKYYQAYDNHKYTLSASLSHSIKKDWFSARVRNYDSCRQAALFSDDVAPKVYDSLISAVKAKVPYMVKYMELRKKVMNLDEVRFFDTYTPLIDSYQFSMSYEEAVETCVEALNFLGEDYTKTLKAGLFGGWVDRYENKGKRSGAYSSGCYDSVPYILLNYEASNINSLYTLIHEAGHSMHSYYSIKEQPYHYHDYTIFVAEVASTFNETLLSDYLLKKYSDDPLMQAYILNREIDNLRGTLYRQTMFAEFELIAHTHAENDTPLTLELFREEYRKLLETYFGGSLHIDEVLELECFRIPHFYSPFYVYKYATGISAAVSLASAVIDGDTAARDKYRKFLTLGGSMFPINELKEAGVDMTESTPVERTLDRFGDLVDKLEKLMGEIGKG